MERDRLGQIRRLAPRLRTAGGSVADADGAAMDRRQAEDGFDQGRLARAVMAQQRHALTGGKGKGDIVKNAGFPAVLCDMVD